METLQPLTTQTPPSYIYPTSLPPTPSLLSRPSSRPSSTTRLRSLLPQQPLPSSASTPSFKTPHHKRSQSTNVPHPNTALAGNAGQTNAPHQSQPQRRRPLRATNETEDDWLTRTASTLTLTRLEEKGQSWLAARESSTSLGGEADDEFSVGGVRSQMPSARGSKSRSGAGGVGKRGERAGEKGEDVGPDFVDVEEDEDEGEVVDEGEMRRVVMGRVGGWVDWAVGWMDFRGEGEGEEEEGGGGDSKEGGLDVREVGRRLQKRAENEGDGGKEWGERAEPPPDVPTGAWDDAKWLLGMASRVAI